MIKKIFALPVIEQISPVLSRRKLDELDLIVVDHPQVKASFALQGAHLLSWKACLLYTSDAADEL